MTKYTDRVAEGKQFRTDVYGRRITDESVPKFIIAGAHTSSPDETWHTPKIAGPYRYPTKIEDTASWDAWTGAMMLDARMPAFVRLVLSRFALHYNLNDGRCDPANALVALELGTSKREVRKALSIGESHGWVEREERHGKHGGPQSNIVHLTYPAEIRAMMSGESERTKIASERTNESPQRGQMSPPNREVEQRSIEHSVLTYGIAERDASFQGIYESIFGQEGSEAKSGPSGRERNGTSPRRERSDPGKPYTSDDVELVSAALNDGDKTYAGIVKATEQPGAIGDGVGIERNLLRRVLDDCMRVGLIGTERRNGKDYFWMTEYACGVPDWMDVL